MSILVSINCITYNHEDYIADAIDSFLMQKTNFDFEILIGEDCSVDGTKKIVEKYVSKYSEKIKLVTSDNNVGARRNAQRLRENSKGKYIALCEGDDYWTTPYKLQKQVDYLESHPECKMCFHGAEIVKFNKTPTGKLIRPSNKDVKYSTRDFIIKGGFFPTASIVFPKYLMDNPPWWFMEPSIGDIPLALILSSHGYAYYIDEVMSVYRTGVKGSWTNRNFSDENLKQKMIKICKEEIFILDKFNEYTYYKYSKDVDNAKLMKEFEILVLEKKMNDMRNERYKDHLEKLKLKGRIKLYARYYFPEFYKKITHLKKCIRELKINLKT